MSLESWTAFLGDKPQLVIAGFFGGVMRWITLHQKWQDGLLSLIAGSICAAYLGPLGVPMIEPVLGKIVTEPGARSGLGGFLIGIGGIAVVGGLIDLWKLRAAMANKGQPQ